MYKYTRLIFLDIVNIYTYVEKKLVFAFYFDFFHYVHMHVALVVPTFLSCANKTG